MGRPGRGRRKDHTKLLADEGIDCDQPQHGSHRSEEVTGRAAAVGDEGPGRGERPAQPVQWVVADVVQDHVVPDAPFGEVVPGVVEDVRGAQ